MAGIPTFRLSSEGGGNNGQRREDIYPGLEVDIILKKDQRSGKRTRGIVEKLLTSAAFHSRGIKVRLEDGQVGRVAEIIGD
ncbi:YwbE family protein [Mucilaginibacter sp. UR6-1]|uniref:YwbE family protein n=1 Tax=Mucilaginibacter sp. UR6-1 TaxID=1435643 RepID=UPI001E34FBA0|nr:YwbE family protein [Mucilaginibacter sp. UR6-1]MCC8409876.1 YwbE family protein [Mucilaginibacter sp. UR6-1]